MPDPTNPLPKDVPPMNTDHMPPNPLPCGCIAELWTRSHPIVRHCPLHAKAAELRAALELIAEVGEADGSPFALSAAKTARAALESTKGPVPNV